MYCITTEVAVKIHMFFEKYDRNAFTRQEQGQNGPGRAAPHNTARCLFYLPTLKYLWSYQAPGLSCIVLHNSTSKVAVTKSYNTCFCVFCWRQGAYKRHKNMYKRIGAVTKLQLLTPDSEGQH